MLGNLWLSITYTYIALYVDADRTNNPLQQKKSHITHVVLFFVILVKV